MAAFIRTGGNARYACAPLKALVKVPSSIDAAEAVAMVSTFTTAYQALKQIQHKGPVFSMLHKKVLVTNAMDGPAQAIIQLCTKARATVYATGPIHRHTYIQNILGAHPLPETGWLTPAIEGSMDYVFDGLCEDGLETPHKALKNESGELVCFGHTALLREQSIGLLGAPISAHVNRLWCRTYANAKRIDIWESYCNDPETYKVRSYCWGWLCISSALANTQKNLCSLLHLLKWDKIKPQISKRVGLEGVAVAQTKLENGELRGTVVCLPWKGKASA